MNIIERLKLKWMRCFCEHDYAFVIETYKNGCLKIHISPYVGLCLVKPVHGKFKCKYCGTIFIGMRYGLFDKIILESETAYFNCQRAKEKEVISLD